MRIPFAIPDPSTRPFDIVGLGQNSVDYVAVAATYPFANTKQRMESLSVLREGRWRPSPRVPGGCAATWARLEMTKRAVSRDTRWQPTASI